MSRPTEDRAIVDPGLKALAFDSGPPLVCDEQAATYDAPPTNTAALLFRRRKLARVRLVPGHCDPTANRVEQLWPITARGAGY
jgi:D-serine deaminase-like pyridoxal phosphate-dependent protein